MSLARMILLVVSMGAIACSSTYGRGTLSGNDGYVADELPLRIRSPALGTLSSRWNIDSHQPNGQPLVGYDYLHIRHIDWNDDGRNHRYRAYVYHLRMGEQRGPGAMWVQSTLVEPDVQSRELEYVADSFMNALAEGPQSTGWSPAGMFMRQQGSQARIQLLDRTDGQLRGDEAHLVFFDVVKNDATARMALLFVRAPFYFEQQGSFGKSRGWPVMLVVGYANGPDRFAEGLSDFNTLIESIEMSSNASRFAAP